jgi:lysosomal acid lipase/cholesteryl ester hydrolase
MYDYGWFRNLLRYGDFFPPEYELAAIPSRLRFLVAHGGRDALADDADVRHLLQVLPANAAQTLLVPQFAHGDFVLGSSAKSLVYDNLLLFFDSSP